MLESKGRPERLLIAGRDGSGKSKSWWDIAEFLHNTGSPAQVFVIDPDLKARFDPRYPLSNVHIFDELEQWQDFRQTAIKCRGKGEKGRGDWLVVEMMSKVWSAAQAGHSQIVFGKDIDDLMVSWRQTSIAENKDGGNPFSGATYGADWQVINALYDTFMFNVTRFPGNVLMTTALDSVTDDEKDKETIRRYSKHGVKPAGQKRLGHVPADLLLFQETARGWTMTQMRGTGRPEFKNEVLDNFVTSYLIAKAGWTL